MVIKECWNVKTVYGTGWEEEVVRWWSIQRLHKRNIFFPAPFPRTFLYFLLSFFLENSQKQVFCTMS